MAVQQPYSAGQQPQDLTLLANVKQWLSITGKNIAGVSNANPGVVTTQGNHGLLSGMVVPLDQIVGMAALNNVFYQITVLTPTTFSIGIDTTSTGTYGTYGGGGYVGTDDALIGRIITAASQFIQSWLNRTIRSVAYTDVRNGYGQDLMAMNQYPIQSVTSVTINGVAIPLRGVLTTTSDPTGFTYDNDTVYLVGYCFVRGRQNVTIVYRAGYQVTGEPQTIPATGPYTLQTMAYWNAGDVGVTYASNGAALVAVTGAPAAGQYSYTIATQTYTFNAADAGKGVLISYSYVPIDVEQACIELIGDYFKARERIGVASMGIEGQTISFTNTMSERVSAVLNQYRKVTPIQ